MKGESTANWSNNLRKYLKYFKILQIENYFHIPRESIEWEAWAALNMEAETRYWDGNFWNITPTEWSLTTLLMFCLTVTKLTFDSLSATLHSGWLDWTWISRTHKSNEIFRKSQWSSPSKPAGTVEWAESGGDQIDWVKQIRQ